MFCSNFQDRPGPIWNARIWCLFVKKCVCLDSKICFSYFVFLKLPKIIEVRKILMVCPQIFFERKYTGLVRFRSRLIEQKKSEQKILSLKKVMIDQRSIFFGPKKWTLGNYPDSPFNWTKWSSWLTTIQRIWVTLGHVTQSLTLSLNYCGSEGATLALRV